ncbi:MAG: class I SAM-dependent methyltransferase, partial [Chloroflexi bacterium]|nr:class I SAM-dependent methyltransferase [Chloroflexota bacterium]
MTTQDTSPADAIIQVLQRLNIQRAHFAAFGSDPEWQGLASQHRDRIASMSVVTPGPFPAQAVASLGPRLLAVFGDQGPQPGQAQTMADLLPAAKFAQLKDYRVLIWSDVARERTSELTSALLGHVKHAQSQQDGTATVCSQATELRGELGGVRYHVQGQGPALVLLPLGLSHSQWEPMLPALREKFCTIVLRGPMLGSAAFLEERGRQPGYLRVVGNVIDAMQIRPEESVLEVGSGSGVLARWLAQRTRGQNPIVGVDINRYLLDEAMALVQTDGLAGQVRFQEGNAEALPFPDAGFDIVWSCT